MQPLSLEESMALATELAIEAAGGAAKVARHFRIECEAVRRWKSKHKRIPVDRVAGMTQLQTLITAKEMRPDLDHDCAA